ncbi:hypothetical protein, conserved [Leishmania tarentolae]|uniref:Uncharacterized protein n=1 Tax=Leishmania tarentolae TaxID=5689 RepID=A0A640KPG0_LEITA|nr:hypothetical protein, conserved [Leishmania tarentolae]
MQTSAALPATVFTEPLFATVMFIGEDSTQGNTLRVPISTSTTVRRLAKDAMQRLVLSRRNVEGCINTPALVVTEVYVGGTGAQPKAEVFAQDCVTQVVLVKEEVIYMRLRGMSMLSAPSQHASLPPPPQQTNGFSATCGAIAACSDHDAQPTVSAASPSLKESSKWKNEAESATEVKCSSPKTSAPLQEEAKAAATHAMSQKRPRTGAAVAAASTMSEPLVTKADEAPRRRLGWGPEAYELFPDNYMSTPGKRPRTVRSEKKPTAQTAKCFKTESSSATVASTKAGCVEESSDKQAPADKHLGWGPEASKLFADNYVSSPEKLARLQRSKRRATHASMERAAPARAAAPTKSAPKAPVCRALQYPTVDTEEGRTTVGHVVDDAIVVDETSPTVELPKGWGRESLKFFDPNTYCDDPAKARLLPNMDYSRSRRHRRPATL